MYGGADIVVEARKCELLSARATADGRSGLVDAHGQPGARERHGGRQAVGSAAYDYRIDGGHVLLKLPKSRSPVPSLLSRLHILEPVLTYHEQPGFSGRRLAHHQKALVVRGDRVRLSLSREPERLQREEDLLWANGESRC